MKAVSTFEYHQPLPTTVEELDSLRQQPPPYQFQTPFPSYPHPPFLYQPRLSVANESPRQLSQQTSKFAFNQNAQSSAPKSDTTPYSRKTVCDLALTNTGSITADIQQPKYERYVFPVSDLKDSSGANRLYANPSYVIPKSSSDLLQCGYSLKYSSQYQNSKEHFTDNLYQKLLGKRTNIGNNSALSYWSSKYPKIFPKQQQNTLNNNPVTLNNCQSTNGMCLNHLGHSAYLGTVCRSCGLLIAQPPLKYTSRNVPFTFTPFNGVVSETVSLKESHEKICNYGKPAEIVASCVTKSDVIEQTKTCGGNVVKPNSDFGNVTSVEDATPTSNICIENVVSLRKTQDDMVKQNKTTSTSNPPLSNCQDLPCQNPVKNNENCGNLASSSKSKSEVPCSKQNSEKQMKKSDQELSFYDYMSDSLFEGKLVIDEDIDATAVDTSALGLKQEQSNISNTWTSQNNNLHQIEVECKVKKKRRNRAPITTYLNSKDKKTFRKRYKKANSCRKCGTPLTAANHMLCSNCKKLIELRRRINKQVKELRSKGILPKKNDVQWSNTLQKLAFNQTLIKPSLKKVSWKQSNGDSKRYKQFGEILVSCETQPVWKGMSLLTFDDIDDVPKELISVSDENMATVFNCIVNNREESINSMTLGFQNEENNATLSTDEQEPNQKYVENKSLTKASIQRNLSTVNFIVETDGASTNELVSIETMNNNFVNDNFTEKNQRTNLIKFNRNIQDCQVKDNCSGSTSEQELPKTVSLDAHVSSLDSEKIILISLECKRCLRHCMESEKRTALKMKLFFAFYSLCFKQLSKRFSKKEILNFLFSKFYNSRALRRFIREFPRSVSSSAFNLQTRRLKKQRTNNAILSMIKKKNERRQNIFHTVSPSEREAKTVVDATNNRNPMSLDVKERFESSSVKDRPLSEIQDLCGINGMGSPTVRTNHSVVNERIIHKMNSNSLSDAKSDIEAIKLQISKSFPDDKKNNNNALVSYQNCSRKSYSVDFLSESHTLPNSLKGKLSGASRTLSPKSNDGKESNANSGKIAFRPSNTESRMSSPNLSLIPGSSNAGRNSFWQRDRNKNVNTAGHTIPSLAQRNDDTLGIFPSYWGNRTVESYTSQNKNTDSNQFQNGTDRNENTTEKSSYKATDFTQNDLRKIPLTSAIDTLKQSSVHNKCDSKSRLPLTTNDVTFLSSSTAPLAKVNDDGSTTKCNETSNCYSKNLMNEIQPLSYTTANIAFNFENSLPRVNIKSPNGSVNSTVPPGGSSGSFRNVYQPTAATPLANNIGHSRRNANCDRLFSQREQITYTGAKNILFQNNPLTASHNVSGQTSLNVSTPYFPNKEENKLALSIQSGSSNKFQQPVFDRFVEPYPVSAYQTKHKLRSYGITKGTKTYNSGSIEPLSKNAMSVAFSTAKALSLKCGNALHRREVSDPSSKLALSIQTGGRLSNSERCVESNQCSTPTSEACASLKRYRFEQPWLSKYNTDLSTTKPTDSVANSSREAVRNFVHFKNNNFSRTQMNPYENVIDNGKQLYQPYLSIQEQMLPSANESFYPSAMGTSSAPFRQSQIKSNSAYSSQELTVNRQSHNDRYNAINGKAISEEKTHKIDESQHRVERNHYQPERASYSNVQVAPQPVRVVKPTPIKPCVFELPKPIGDSYARPLPKLIPLRQLVDQELYFPSTTLAAFVPEPIPARGGTNFQKNAQFVNPMSRRNIVPSASEATASYKPTNYHQTSAFGDSSFNNFIQSKSETRMQNVTSFSSTVKMLPSLNKSTALLYQNSYDVCKQKFETFFNENRNTGQKTTIHNHSEVFKNLL